MRLKSINPTQTTAWENLHYHFESIKDEHMVSWFNDNPNRTSEMSVKWEDFFLDFSKNRITSETLKLLKNLNIRNFLSLESKIIRFVKSI